jgi:tetratricopeptide (TPR) repeat protein
MTTLLALASLAGTFAVGLAAVTLLQRGERSRPGEAWLVAGVAYPVGALIVALWMRALAAIGVAWSLPIVALLPALGFAAIAWRVWQAKPGDAAARAARFVLDEDGRIGRVVAIALVTWLVLRFVFVLSEVLARPPLPWEAWLDTAARGSVWYAWRGVVPFVPAVDWTGERYLASLTLGHSMLPLLDAYTAFVLGRFDDTVIHAPWPMFWLSPVLLSIGALRSAGASAVASLAAGALVGTLPLANAHAALGGTSALPLAAYLLAATVFTLRASTTRAIADVALAVASIAGMLWASRAGLLWLPVLVPIVAAAWRPARAPQVVAGLVTAAAIAASALARTDPFGRGLAPGAPPPGMSAVAEQALLLGNWHLLAYATIALAALAWRQWRTHALVGLSGAVGVGLAVIAVFATTSAGRVTIGLPGVLAQAGTTLAPLLALWVAQVAWAWARDSAVTSRDAAMPPVAAGDVDNEMTAGVVDTTVTTTDIDATSTSTSTSAATAADAATGRPAGASPPAISASAAAPASSTAPKHVLDLPEVTLACIDTANHALALRALERSRERIGFARVVLLTDALPHGLACPAGIDVVPIRRLESRDDYSRFVLKELVPHVATSHVLLVQWDGYVVNPEAWDPAFLDCDFLGARWFWHADGHDVGNGGFSLRSWRLLMALQDPRIELVEAEDTTIGRSFRDLLERDHGIRFGSAALADRFAFEAAYPVGRPFGFHGLFNFCRTVPPAELAALAPRFSDAIAGSPQLLQLLRNCVAMAQWAPAIAIAKRMLATTPEHAEALALLAQAEGSLAAGAGIGRNDPCPCGSGKRYKQCHGAAGARAPAPAAMPTVTPPPSADALVARAMAAHQRGDLDAAERDYRAALASAPEHPHALHYLGVIDYQRGRPEEALLRLQIAVSRLPAEPEFHNNLGLVLAALDRNEEAVAAHRHAIELKPDHAGAWTNLGLVLTASNALDDAIDAFDRALALAPALTAARWNRSLALLAAGRFREGWRDYEARLDVPAFADPGWSPKVPRWEGRDPRGLTLLLAAEQGLGDAIQFVRLARPLAARGARVIVQSPRLLAGLFRSAEGVAHVVAAGDPLPPHDAWLPLLSLAGVLGIDASSIPASVPYLAADPQRRAAAAAKLAPFAPSLRVGLAWAGNPRHANDRRRSAPLSALLPLFDLPGVTWVSLQKVEGRGAMPATAEASRLVSIDTLDDFDATTALVSELDLVVSVDTSVAHLAGALARPTFVLLPYAADWRWRAGRSDTPWYPTATLFRQRAPGDWASVAADARAAITALAAQPR